MAYHFVDNHRHRFQIRAIVPTAPELPIADRYDAAAIGRV
jgi:hypothetical protein